MNPSDVPNPAPGTPSRAVPPSPFLSLRFSLKNVLVLALPVVAVVGLIAAWMYFSIPRVEEPNYRDLVKPGVLISKKLADEFTDADRDLVADPPTDPAKLIDPETLFFSTLGYRLESEKETWKEFVDHLAKATGKKVEHVEKPNGIRGAIEAIKEGKIHVLTLSTGSVPGGVNEGGFVPMCVMAAPDGSFQYEMEILVPADGAIKTPADVRGKTMTASGMSSQSSFKAPVVVLWKEFGLLIGRDYDVIQGAGQEPAIKAVCEGKAEVVPVANDVLKRMVAAGQADPAKYRSIYKSKGYPPACFGHPHNLKPELAKKIREAFVNYDWKGTTLEKAFAAANQTKFVPVSYKEHWAVVRENDEQMEEVMKIAR